MMDVIQPEAWFT